MPIIYADFRLDYKLATLPIAKPVTLRTFAAIGVISGLSAPDFAGGRSSPEAFAGTPEFASPEQFAGIQVDNRSDLYSLGVTLWVMVTGIHRFEVLPLVLDGLEPLQNPPGAQEGRLRDPSLQGQCCKFVVEAKICVDDRQFSSTPRTDRE